MKQISLLAAFLFTGLSFTLAQAPNIQWQKSLGGSAPDEAFCIVQTTDGGYAISGDAKSNNGDVTGNHGDWDFWVVKLDSTGTLQWQKSLGGSLPDQLPSMVQATDGGYVVCGASQSQDGDITAPRGDWDYWVVKLDSAGNILWEKSYGGTGYDYPHTVINTADGGYAIAGSSGSTNGDVTGNHGGTLDYWILKIDSAGAIQWQKSFGGSGMDWGFSIVQTPDRGYASAGYSDSKDGDVTGNNGQADYWMIRLDSTGKLLWNKSFGTVQNENCNSIDMTTDHGFVLGGYSGGALGNHGQDDYWVVKVDSLGNTVWAKSPGGSQYDWGRMVKATTDGGCVINGYSGSNDGNVDPSNHGGYDYWVVKLDYSGNIVWQRVLGGSGYEAGYPIIQTRDEGYVVSGSSNSNNGDVTGNHGFPDYWVVKLECALPLTPGTIKGDTVACKGFDVVYSVPAIGNASGYNWTVPTGASITSGANSNTVVVHFSGSAVAGSISVTGISKCGAGPTSSLTVNVATASIAGFITGTEDSICEGSGKTSLLTATGSSGNIEWQSSVDGVHFTAISGATGSAYTTPAPSVTTYYRTYANNGGCASDSSNIFVVNLVPSPSATFTFTVSGMQVSFNSSGTTGATYYDWDFGDTTANSSSPNPIHTYANKALHQVCLTVYNATNCSFTYCMDVDLTGVGTKDIALNTQVNIFPDPVMNEFTLSLSPSLMVKELRVINILGQVMKVQTINEPQSSALKMDLSGLPAGIYELLVLTESQPLALKLVKE